MSSLCSALTFKDTGSLRASPPAAIKIDDRPAKRSGRPDRGTVAAPVPAMATDAAPTRNGRAPKALVSRTRTRSPPVVRNTMLRTVWLFTPLSAGQLKAGPGMVPPGTGLPCQAFTQRAGAWPLASPGTIAPDAAADAGTVASVAAAIASAAPMDIDRHPIPHHPAVKRTLRRGKTTSGGQRPSRPAAPPGPGG